MNSSKFILLGCLVVMSLVGMSCGNNRSSMNQDFMHKSVELWNNTLSHYGIDSRIENVFFFKESYQNSANKERYVVDGDTLERERIASLWSTSSVFSATNVLLKATYDKQYAEWLEEVMVPTIESYWDTTRVTAGFQSYPVMFGRADCYYDDNSRIGQEFLNLYEWTENLQYLSKAKAVWDFLQTGTDDELGGGVYWSEFNRNSKHVCTNAPAVILSLRLYQMTLDEKYLNAGKQLYHWTKTTLQDPTDGLYYDNIQKNGIIDKTKYSYNSGQMMHAASLLYRITKEKGYLNDAQKLADSCSREFFSTYQENDSDVVLLDNGHIGFVALMLRGYEELYGIDKNSDYIHVYQNTLNRLWIKGRDKNGFFSNGILNNSFQFSNDKKSLLTQGALVEMYARLSTIE